MRSHDVCGLSDPTLCPLEPIAAQLSYSLDSVTFDLQEHRKSTETEGRVSDIIQAFVLSYGMQKNTDSSKRNKWKQRF